MITTKQADRAIKSGMSVKVETRGFAGPAQFDLLIVRRDRRCVEGWYVDSIQRRYLGKFDRSDLTVVAQVSP